LVVNTFLTPVRPRYRAAALCTALTVTVIAVAAVVAVRLSGTGTGTATGSGWAATAVSSPGTAADPASISAGPSASAAPVPDRAVSPVVDDLPAGSGVVALPRGTRNVATIRTGYPLTMRGAVAAAVEYTTHSGCLDQECVDAMTAAALDTTWTEGRAVFTAGMRHGRSTLGIPGHSRVPAGAMTTPTPMAFQIAGIPANSAAAAAQAGDDAPRVRVLVLTYLAMAGPAISPRNTVVVLPVTLRWTGTDWKLVDGDQSYPELAARPGTPQAAALGWRDFIA
jgi:hypothetical protein